MVNVLGQNLLDLFRDLCENKGNSSQTSHLLKQFVEKETGIPVLSSAFDLADSRIYSAEALRTKVETFADTLRIKKASAGT